MVTGRKLLLADDSVTIQKVVDLTFADEGMQVTTVSDGLQAIKKLEEVAPDIVLVDVFMPGLTGYEVCDRIKQDGRFRHIPVMLLVGSFEPFDEAEARRVGADDYLTKPFQSIRQLVGKVSALLGSGTVEGEATTGELSPPKEEAAATSQPGDHTIQVAEADITPAPQQSEGAADQKAPVAEEASTGAKADDEMIEAKAASDDSETTIGWEIQQPAAAPTAVTGLEASVDTWGADLTPEQMQETLPPFEFEEMNDQAPGGQPAPSSRTTDTALEDDSLLDLGDIGFAPAAAEADDFILDLQDEAYMLPPEPDAPPPVEETGSVSLADLEESVAEAAPPPVEFVEAQIIGEERRAEFAPVEEVEPQVIAPPEGISGTRAEAQTEGESAAPGAAPHGGQIGLDQLSPEVIEAIAQRAVEHLSEKVVQEIAWEVVPQLAELLIKRRLDEERSRAQ